MSATYASIEDHHELGLYELRIKGHLDDKWAAWFEGLTLTREDNGETLLTGTIVDQAALYGLLRKVRDVGYHYSRSLASDPARPMHKISNTELKQEAEKGGLSLIYF